jgi:hypothetical protein
MNTHPARTARPPARHVELHVERDRACDGVPAGSETQELRVLGPPRPQRDAELVAAESENHRREAAARRARVSESLVDLDLRPRGVGAERARGREQEPHGRVREGLGFHREDLGVEVGPVAEVPDTVAARRGGVSGVVTHVAQQRR